MKEKNLTRSQCANWMWSLNVDSNSMESYWRNFSQKFREINFLTNKSYNHMHTVRVSWFHGIFSKSWYFHTVLLISRKICENNLTLSRKICFKQICKKRFHVISRERQKKTYQNNLTKISISLISNNQMYKIENNLVY